MKGRCVQRGEEQQCARGRTPVLVHSQVSSHFPEPLLPHSQDDGDALDSSSQAWFHTRQSSSVSFKNRQLDPTIQNSVVDLG